MFCTEIGFTTNEIEFIAGSIDAHYKEWFEDKIDKSTGDLKKHKDGTVKQRVIRPSLGALKEVQRKIKSKILEPIILPQQIHGGIKKKSNVTNAKPHQGKKYQFTTDLLNFYPSIKYRRIYDTFLKLGYSNHYSHWLTKLVSWKGDLPQGAPTSGHIANLVFLKTDYLLIDFCNEHGLTYTRYVDDITISSAQCFKHLLNDILNLIIHDNFKINYRKTLYAGNQNITGVDVRNNFIDAPLIIKLKMMRTDLSDKSRKAYENYIQQIRKTNKGVITNKS